MKNYINTWLGWGIWNIHTTSNDNQSWCLTINVKQTQTKYQTLDLKLIPCFAWSIDIDKFPVLKYQLFCFFMVSCIRPLPYCCSISIFYCSFAIFYLRIQFKIQDILSMQYCSYAVQAYLRVLTKHIKIY